TDDVCEFRIRIGFANLHQDRACFSEPLPFREPARASRDTRQKDEKQRGWNCGHTQVPTPFRLPEVKPAEQIVRKISNKNAKHYIELKKSHQPAAQLGRCDFGDVQGSQPRRSAKAKSADT